MLQFLRKKGNIKKIMWGLALVIVPAFVLWGAGSNTSPGSAPKYAGTMFGRKVSFTKYQEALKAFYNQALLIYGDQFKQATNGLNMEQQAWQRLILLHQVKKEKIKVSDQEVVSFIQSVALFQKDSHFDRSRYNTILDYALGISPREFEEQIRQELAMDKLKNKIIAAVTLNNEEIETVYKYENEQAKVSYVLIDPKEFQEQINPSYEELEDYHLIHKSEFKKPEQVNAEYIALYFNEAAIAIELTEEEIDNYYNAHLDELSVSGKDSPEKPKTKDELTPQIKQKLIQEKLKQRQEERIWQISDELAEDEATLEKIAGKNKLELKETGFFGAQDVISDIGLSYKLSNAAFSLEVGEISNVIETTNGYFIIQIKGKKDAYLPQLEEVKKEVEAAVIKERMWQLAKKKGRNIQLQLSKLIDDEKLDFAKAAKKLALSLRETEDFTRASYITGIGQSPSFTQAAFKLEEGKISALITVASGYCIVSLISITPIDQEKFDQEKKVFSQKLLDKKKNIHYQIWLNKLNRKANLTSNLSKLSAKGG